MTEYKSWFNNPDIRPYVLVRKNNLPLNPGSFHQFHFSEPILKDPFYLREASFANQILKLENRCFKASGMTLPRWAFYDCSLMPGLVVGFAYRTRALPQLIRNCIAIDDSLEFTPISLFIAIPTNELGYWVAHNLCSVNSILPYGDRYSCLGFLTKAFGLWYFNIQRLYGMAQWAGNALKVHTSYGDMQVISSYTEIHDYPETLTYLLDSKSERWHDFVNDVDRPHSRKPSQYFIDPKDKSTMKLLQSALEKGEGPFYLVASDFAKNQERIQIYL